MILERAGTSQPRSTALIGLLVAGFQPQPVQWSMNDLSRIRNRNVSAAIQ
jgi:hypothetical protein